MSNLGTRWTDPVTKGGFQVNIKGEQRGDKNKGNALCIVVHRNACRVYNGMIELTERYQLYICITIIIGMNVVDNLNSV
jgi:hypothetical protein